MLVGSRLAATIPRRSSQRPLPRLGGVFSAVGSRSLASQSQARCFASLTPAGQPVGWLSPLRFGSSRSAPPAPRVGRSSAPAPRSGLRHHARLRSKALAGLPASLVWRVVLPLGIPHPRCQHRRRVDAAPAFFSAQALARLPPPGGHALPLSRQAGERRLRFPRRKLASDLSLSGLIFPCVRPFHP